jgi:hypothetical protein
MPGLILRSAQRPERRVSAYRRPRPSSLLPKGQHFTGQDDPGNPNTCKSVRPLGKELEGRARRRDSTVENASFLYTPHVVRMRRTAYSRHRMAPSEHRAKREGHLAFSPSARLHWLRGPDLLSSTANVRRGADVSPWSRTICTCEPKPAQKGKRPAPKGAGLDRGCGAGFEPTTFGL